MVVTLLSIFPIKISIITYKHHIRTVMAGNTFISRKEFDDSVAILKKEEKVKNWIELAEDIIFKIISITPRVSVKYGDCHILLVTTEDGTQTRVWSPAPLVKRIQQKRKSDEVVYFISLGQEIINRTKKINRFELMYQKDRDVDPEIFVYGEEVDKEN